jgi:hypothetical protein
MKKVKYEHTKGEIVNWRTENKMTKGKGTKEHQMIYTTVKTKNWAIQTPINVGGSILCFLKIEQHEPQ